MPTCHHILLQRYNSDRQTKTTHITRRELIDRLEIMGFEIAYRYYCESLNDGSLHTYQHSTNIDERKQRTLILGLKSNILESQKPKSKSGQMKQTDDTKK